MKTVKPSDLDPVKLYKTEFCDDNLKLLIVSELEDLLERFSLDEILKSGSPYSYFTLCNSEYEAVELFNASYLEIAHLVNQYAELGCSIKDIFKEFNENDPMCSTPKNKKLAVWFCISMICVTISNIKAAIKTETKER